MRGEYILTKVDENGNEGEEIVIPNSLIAEGQYQLWNALFNKDDIVDWSFVFGVFAEVPVYSAVAAAQYTTEPTIGIAGYARTTENPTGWTITAETANVYAESPVQQFIAGGGAFDKAFDRFFMHLKVENPATTFTEYLVSYSSALAAPVTLTGGQTYNLRYRIYLK